MPTFGCILPPEYSQATVIAAQKDSKKKQHSLNNPLLPAPKKLQKLMLSSPKKISKKGVEYMAQLDNKEGPYR